MRHRVVLSPPVTCMLWSLSQPPGFTLAVPQLVSVQEGLCVFVSCNFTYPASYDTDNPSAQLYGQWYKEPATVGQDIPVASSVPNPGVSQETQGRFRLTGDPALGDCSLQISDARQTDAGRYFFNIEKGMLDHTYRSNSDGTDPALTISVNVSTDQTLWSLSQPPGFTLAVPQLVSMQEGLCVFIPCNFTYPASYDTDNPSAQLYGQWYKEPATAGQDPPVASSVPNVGVSQETQGRFQLTGDPALGDCSLQISDARRTDAGRYFLNIDKGIDSLPSPHVSELTEEPEIQISPARGLPGMLLTREPVTVTCTAPGRCSGSPPQVTWTGPFNDTARNVSAQLANGTWAHSSELSFTPGLGDDGKELVCTVTYSSAQGPSTSRTIHSSPPVPAPLGAERDIVSLETQEGDSLSLSCDAGSRADTYLSWAKGKESLSSSQGWDGCLELLNLSRGDAGEYRCWAQNSYGSASQALCVQMQYPIPLSLVCPHCPSPWGYSTPLPRVSFISPDTFVCRRRSREPAPPQRRGRGDSQRDLQLPLGHPTPIACLVQEIHPCHQPGLPKLRGIGSCMQKMHLIPWVSLRGEDMQRMHSCAFTKCTE
uniref:Ig-like domain-containing protein n=1 Tax=Chrysemys picta bellii TaxID=8478 RepID=A0A8C3F3T4_CHRPI